MERLKVGTNITKATRVYGRIGNGRHHLLLDMPCGYQCLYVWCSTLVCNMHLLNLFFIFFIDMCIIIICMHIHIRTYIYIHYQDLCVGWFPKIGVPQNHPL